MKFTVVVERLIPEQHAVDVEASSQEEAESIVERALATGEHEKLGLYLDELPGPVPPGYGTRIVRKKG